MANWLPLHRDRKEAAQERTCSFKATISWKSYKVGIAIFDTRVLLEAIEGPSQMSRPNWRATPDYYLN